MPPTGKMNPSCGPTPTTCDRKHPTWSPEPTDLFIDITDQPHQELLGQELRRTPIEMPIDTVLIIRTRTDEIVGKPRHHKKNSRPVWGLKYA